MKYTVTMTTTNVENFEIEAADEYEAVAITHEMFNTGELDELYDRPWYDITFTCGNAEETEVVQSLV